MKRILYVTTVSRTINAFLVPHIKTLLDEGYLVDCATSIDKEIDDSIITRGVKIYEIPFNRNPLSYSNLKAFKELLNIQKKNNYDIIHVHTPIASIYGRLVKLKFNNIKTIYTAHGYHFFKGSSKLSWIIYYPIEKLMAKLTDLTININREDYDVTKKRLKPRNCWLMNGVGLDLSKYKKLSEVENLIIRKKLGLEKDNFVIIMIAEFNSNKNQIQLIKAMELIKDKYKNIKVICVGDGENYNDLKREIEVRDLTGQIKLLGYREDINDLINISDIGILLSYREGLPRNIMELMACGKRVIATNIRGCRDIVNNKEIGYLVQPGDYKGTSDYIVKLYKEKRLNEELNGKIIENCRTNYNIETINNELVEIYKSITEEDKFNGEMSAHVTNE
ncbi:MAG: glycosyltransferase family 4 protein [Clostridium sp.]|uniref:glycosyltransferase family 4 protein n=1 Tax=Clostridium sp. TaxID=1506 RepID=UPI002FCBB3B9